MPAKLDRCVQKLMKAGKSESSAFAICNAQLKKEKVKDWRVLEFYVPIEESVIDGDDFMIKGVAINETTTLNNVKYVAEELQKAAPSFRDKPILLDHKNEIKNIVGRTTENVNFNPTFNRIDFEAKIMDKDIKEMIKDGRIGSVSIGAKVQDLVEEEDGSMKAVGIKGLEISLVAVPGDSHANLAQAIQQGMILKEKAELDKLNIEENQMTEDQKAEDVEKVEEPVEEEKEKPEEKEESTEPTEEKVQKINVKVDTTEIADMKSQIAELKELLMEKKKVQEEVEDEKEEKEDETKGEVSTEAEEKLDNINNMIVEAVGRGNFSMYKDYSKDSNLKRLIR